MHTCGSILRIFKVGEAPGECH